MRPRFKDSKKRKKFSRFSSQVRKKCRFCKNKTESLDYKDTKTLERFMNDRGKIGSRRATGNCAKHQRMVAGTIKKARFISLLPYTK